MRAPKQTWSENPTAPGILNFKGKRVTVMGINPEGRGVQDAEFLASCDAKVTATDTKNEKDLKESVVKLKKYKNISFVLGGHRLRDFQNKDLVIRAAGAPLDSVYLKEAKKNGIEIRTDETIFLELAPKITLVGITGTKGKSTTTHLIYEILKKSGCRVFLAGNVRGQAALPLLKKVREGDIVVMELDSWKLQGFGDAKISPRVAVFTNFYQDHLNYYKGDVKRYFSDKSNIFKYQKKGDTVIIGKSAREAMKKYYNGKIRSNVILAGKKDFPKPWRPIILGEHNQENMALAIKACEALGVSKSEIKKGVENFKGVTGRLEFIGEINGIKYYNDTTATTPDATIAALKTLNSKKVILLAGGADKNLNYRELAKTIPKFVKTLILFKGEASDKLLKEFRISNFEFRIHSGIEDMKEAMRIAQANAKRGDIILLSPAAASFGIFKNEFDRGEQFCNNILKL